MNIGKQIKAQRELNNWTQQELADKLKITRPAISRYETNDRQPDAETLVALADAFGTTVDELLGRE